ncbi:TerC family protein [Andreprevotia chitinilytica]|uniref:TerC family protein n=1 Tax=Andreprevotia chitinilytica TaxID=396808 RepID=UPI00068AF587|nr:TerC family protein [Andreprevotia chitinilytica]
MGFDSLFNAAGISLQALLIDLLLSGDNAVMIALACRGLPPQQRRQAMLLGVGAAIVLRVVLAGVVNVFLNLPMLKLIGALVLLWIAIRLMVDQEEPDVDEVDVSSNLWAAAITIIVADLAMSLDNVVALAALAQGNLLFMAFGVFLSVPLLMFGSTLAVGLMARYPQLIVAGGALLGWIAGSIAVADPLVADWINTQSPALTVVIPLMAALFVPLQSRNVLKARALAPPKSKRIRPAKPARVDLPVSDAVAPVMPVTESITATPPVSVIAKRNTGKWVAAGLVAMAIICIGLLVLTPGHRDAKTSGGSLFYPAPSQNTYRCAEIDATLLYRHGGMNVSLHIRNAEVNGYLDQGKLTWSMPARTAAALGIKLPSRISGDSARTVVLGYEGGVVVQCVLSGSLR